MKLQSKIQHRKILIILLAAVLSLSFLTACGGQKEDQKAQENARVGEILSSLFWSTEADAQALEEAILGGQPAATDTNTTPGIYPADDQALMAYLKDRYGDYMTDDCIEQLMQNRTFGIAASHVQSQGTEIVAGETSYQERKETEHLYDFEVEIKSNQSKTPLQTVTGTIQVEEVEGIWKAVQITIN